jgi:hypothetical protein
MDTYIEFESDICVGLGGVGNRTSFDSVLAASMHFGVGKHCNGKEHKL